MILNSRVVAFARQWEITGEPLNSHSRILALNRCEITGVDCIGHIKGMLGPIDMKKEMHRMGARLIEGPRICTSPMTSTLDFQCQILKKLIPGMGWPMDMERKGCESIGYWTHFVTLRYDLDLRFSRLGIEKAISQELDDRLTWNERNVSQ